MNMLRLTKPDGRKLLLYSRASRGPIDPSLSAPMPAGIEVKPNPQLRWHPLRGEWVAYASHRQNRTFLPPKEYSPLAVTRSKDFPTELPQGDYDVAVFENLFPSLALAAPAPHESVGVDVKAGVGVCEVVVFTQDPETSLGRLALDHIELLLEVWGHRTRELGAIDEIKYVMPFENRGVEVGVTLHHPHGQIYSYPFVPPVPAREVAQQLAHFERKGSTLMAGLIESERADGRRLLFDAVDTGADESDGAVAFVPACARYPYEVWVTPTAPTPSLEQLTAGQRKNLARAIKTVLQKYESLWNRPFPYLMVIHQAPTAGGDNKHVHLHFEFSPAYRSSDRLKYLAGTELGAGMFANDSLPEAKAAELKAVVVNIDGASESTSL